MMVFIELTLFILLVISLGVLLVGLFLKIVPEHCDSPVCLVGKTVLVTGGSAGIGYEIVIDLAKRGCKVIIADKNVDEDIKRAVIQATNNDNIMLEKVDLASFKSVRNLAERVNQAEGKLDMLINNAGILYSCNDPTEDGLNPFWQVNYYSGFLLTHLLVDLLKKSQSARIIFTSSALAFFNTLTAIDLETKGSTNNLCSFINYSNTKCLNIIASDSFAEKLERFKITSNSFHPGIARTQIFQCWSTSRNWEDYLTSLVLFTLIYLFGKGAKEGAQTGIYLAVAKEVEGVSSKFFGRCSPTWKPKSTTNRPLCERIWELSENVVDLKDDEKL